MKRRPISTRSRINLLATCAVVLTALALVAGRQVLAQASQPDDVQAVSLCFDLPAIGNVESVKEWRFGRIDNVQRVGTEEIRLGIRTRDEKVHRLVCPAQPFAVLAARSNWMRESGSEFPSRRDFVERMVAFAADDSGRVIALTSLEPVARRGRRIADAFRR